MPVAIRLQRFPRASCRLFAQTPARPEGGQQRMPGKRELSEPSQEWRASVSSCSHLKKGIASQTAMLGKLNAGYPPHATARTHWSKDTLGVPLHRPCPLRLDAAEPKRLASGLSFPLFLYSVYRRENVSRDTQIFSEIPFEAARRRHSMATRISHFRFGAPPGEALRVVS